MYYTVLQVFSQKTTKWHSGAIVDSSVTVAKPSKPSTERSERKKVIRNSNKLTGRRLTDRMLSFHGRICRRQIVRHLSVGRFILFRKIFTDFLHVFILAVETPKKKDNTCEKKRGKWLRCYYVPECHEDKQQQSVGIDPCDFSKAVSGANWTGQLKHDQATHWAEPPCGLKSSSSSTNNDNKPFWRTWANC